MPGACINALTRLCQRLTMLTGGVSLYCFSLQPCMVFAGEQFENDADFKLAKSMLLDMFRGRVVEKINLKVYSRGVIVWRHQH